MPVDEALGEPVWLALDVPVTEALGTLVALELEVPVAADVTDVLGDADIVVIQCTGRTELVEIGASDVISPPRATFQS